MKRKTRLSKSAHSRKTSRLVHQNPFGDFDRDGVPNIFDCEPTNPNKHGVEPSETTWERLKSLPIYVSDTSPDKEKYHITDSHSKLKAPIARQRFLSLIKAYPEVLGEMERTSAEQVVFTKARIAKRGVSVHAWMRHQTAGIAFPSDYDPKTGFVVVSLADAPFAKKFAEKWGGGERESAVETAFHELEHIKQFKRWGGKPKLTERMHKGRYSERLEEKLAHEVGEKGIPTRTYEELAMAYPETFEPTFAEKAQTKLWSRAGAVMKGEIPAKGD